MFDSPIYEEIVIGNSRIFGSCISYDGWIWYNLGHSKEKHMSTKCRYCGSTSYGSGCIHSPTRKLEHRDDEKHCEWCGSSSYGSGCIHSPTRKHRHGPGANKCIWCGSTSNGSGCIHSPTGKHEK